MMKSSILSNQHQQRSIVIVGGAVGDIVLTLGQLPISGQDVVAQAQGQQIGGCAFNIARLLKKLEFDVINGIPVGNDAWGMRVAQEMAALGLPILLRHDSLDNGWCLALVEPNGERTFVTVEGCETDWTDINLFNLAIPHDAIVYVSGYELVREKTEKLRHWLLTLPDSVLIFVDLGPRVIDIAPDFLAALFAKNSLLTLNRDEIALLCGKGDNLIDIVQHYAMRYALPIIARLDSHGAWLCQPDKDPIYIAANKVNVVDTIGAGDAHCGGVIAGLAVGLSMPQSVRLGNQIAAVMVSRRGANNPPTRQELAEFCFLE